MYSYKSTNPLSKYTRNLACYCGSGKKFKKCHLNTIPKYINKTQANKLSKYLEQMIDVVTSLKKRGITYQKVEENEDNVIN